MISRILVPVLVRRDELLGEQRVVQRKYVRRYLTSRRRRRASSSPNAGGSPAPVSGSRRHSRCRVSTRLRRASGASVRGDGMDDLDAVDELALAFERALEGCRVAPLASRANALCAVLRVALDDDALDPAFALERETNLVDGTDPTLDPRAPSLSPLASRLLDAVGDRILGAIVVAADAAGTPEAEALACVAARAVAAACAPETRSHDPRATPGARGQVADRDEDAPPRGRRRRRRDVGEARSRRGWRLAGALAESSNAPPPPRARSRASHRRRRTLVRALALAADERHDDDDDDRTPGLGAGLGLASRRSGRDPRVRPRRARPPRRRGARTARVRGRFLRPGDASPKVSRTVAISALSLLALEPRADAVSGRRAPPPRRRRDATPRPPRARRSRRFIFRSRQR